MSLHPPALSRRTALATASAALLAGCSSRPDPRVIRVAYTPVTLRSLYEAVAAAFAKAHPGLSVQLVPATGYDEMMERDIRLALIGDELDVSHAGIYSLRHYVERGLAAPLDDFLKADAGDVTRHATIGVTNGVTHAIPFALSVPVVYYNKDLLSRVGVDPAAFPGTWDAILDAASRISRLPQPISGIYYEYKAGAALGWEALVYSRGGAMMSPDERRVVFAGAEGLWAMNLLRAIGKAGQVDMSLENARVALTGGTLGFYQNTSANLRKFMEQAQNIALGITVMPMSAAGTLPAAGNLALIPARDPARRALAWKYVSFACGPVGQTIMVRKTGYLSLNHKALADPHGIGAILRNDPLAGKIYAAVPRLRPWCAFPGPNSGRIADMITDTMRLVILGRVAPAAALSAMQSETQRLLVSA